MPGNKPRKPNKADIENLDRLANDAVNGIDLELNSDPINVANEVESLIETWGYEAAAGIAQGNYLIYCDSPEHKWLADDWATVEQLIRERWAKQ
jgi:hypothetical protein